jgi:DNA-binding NtrC family response regulator
MFEERRTIMKRKDHRESEDKIIGNAYKDLKSIVIKYAEMNYPILLVGETGSGKELFAELYMANSNKAGSKLTINCAEFNDQLLTSEIFGHVKGAFTGAGTSRKGLLKSCENGILFLDELGASSTHFQHSILRCSEYNTYRPVGSDKVEQHNTLMIAATNKAEKIIKDLQYRFHILYIPPLQTEDIHLLSRYFFKDKNPKWDMKEEILETLMSRQWPGNVRELIKYFEELYLKHRDKLFGNKLPVKQSFFDYQRYIDELNIWSRHIQPLIDEHNLPFRYQYQNISLEIGQPIPFSASLYEDGESDYYKMNFLELFQCIERKELEALPRFIEVFDAAIIQENLLPNFLYMLNVIDNKKMGKYAYKHSLHMPSIYSFLRMPLNTAKKAFEEFYVRYKLEECNSKKEAAEEMKISQPNLNRILRKQKK